LTFDPVQIVARGPRSAAEAAARRLDQDPELEGCAYSLIEEDERSWRIDAFPMHETEASALKVAFGAFDDLSVREAALADADWLAMALSGLPPVRAGRFFVHGLHDLGRRPANKVALRIEAGAAFGTGHHGTTVGCLLAFDRLLHSHGFRRVLDVGAGTGVLAIAAARTGSRVVRGTDIDPVSVRIASENARLNRTDCRFVRASGLNASVIRRAAPYDLVFANILARPLIGLAGEIRHVLRPRGIAILSGLLHVQARSVLAAYLAHGFHLKSRLRRDAWSTLVLTA